MIALLRNHFEKLLPATGLILLVAGAAWAWTARAGGAAPRRHPVRAAPSGFAYQAAMPRPPGGRPAVWAEPAVQSGGAGWVYEVFTPPVIYYNPLGKSFSVTPTLDPAATAASADESLFVLELLTVKLEPYRLQLAGYFGAPGDYTGVFVSPQVPDPLLARAGRRFARLGLLLKELTVVKVAVEHGDRWPVYDVAAFALLQDERNGTEVTLDSRTRKLTDTLLAVLRLKSANAESHELRVGEAVRDHLTLYRVDRIQLDPPEVMIAKLTPGRPLPETRVLRPAATAGELSRQHLGPEKRPLAPLPAEFLSVNTTK